MDQRILGKHDVKAGIGERIGAGVALDKARPVVKPGGFGAALGQFDNRGFNIESGDGP